MEDPFSNAAAPPPVPGPSSRGYMYGDMLGSSSSSSPPSGHERRASTTLRAVSPHSFEYVPPDTSPNDGDDENSMASGRRRPSSGTAPRGPRQPSLAMGGGYGSTPAPHASYYDEELEHDNSFQHSPTMDLNDEPPFRPNGTRKRGSSSSSNQLLDRDLENRGMQPLDYQDPYDSTNYLTGSRTPPLPPLPEKRPGLLEKMFGDSSLRHPIEQRIENRRRGITRQKRPFVCWILSVVMLGILIYELVFNYQKQHSVISLKPYVNPMLGPSQVGLISLGARWPACMRDVESIPLTLQIGCPSNTANPATKLCSIEQICSWGGFNGATPNQWWRFITPIFLHAGIIHFAFNMFAQLTVSAEVEQQIGSLAFVILYFAAGIFGNVLGGNFALVGLPSVGASGAIFGTVGVLWVDLLAHWGLETKPGRKLTMLCIDLLVGVALGYIPGVDNFVHLGGFLVGLICAAIFLPVISTTRTHKMTMWGVRIAMIPIAIVLFVVLIRNFYKTNPFAACSWCRYLSCIPTSANNKCKGNGLTITTTSS